MGGGEAEGLGGSAGGRRRHKLGLGVEWGGREGALDSKDISRDKVGVKAPLTESVQGAQSSSVS